MTDNDFNGWNTFALTGKISDYLKYRENTLLAMQNTAASDGIFEKRREKTQEKERYERDLYGDRNGFIGNSGK